MKIRDEDLLEILQKDSSLKYKEIAETFEKTLGIKIRDTSIRKRILNLRKKKIIKRYTIDIDQQQLGFELTAFIGLDTDPEKYLDIQETLKHLKPIKQLYTTTGDHMLMFEAWFKTNEDLKAFVKELESTNGITRVCPAIVHQKLK